MQESMTPALDPVQQAGENKAPVRPRTPGVAFADAESAGRWLKSLPLTNVNQLAAALLAQLREMSRVEFPPRERARIAELIREQVAHLHTEFARRYAGKPQPAADTEQDAAEQAIALWTTLWEQYSACLKPLLEGDPELEGVKAKVLQRGLYVGKQLVLVHGLARRAPPPHLWQEIHAYYRLAEILNVAGSAVSDELMPNAVGISCYSTYAHALLLGLADPCALTVKQIELTDRWLQMWARKIYPYAQQRRSEGPTLLVDLNAGAGAALVSAAPRDPPDSLRFAYPHKLSTSVRGRLKRLQTGADPGELQLGRDCNIEQCTLLLSHLDAKWFQLPRSTSSLPRTTVSLCGGGLHGAYFRITGKSFEKSDPLGRNLVYEGGRRGLHLQALGAVTTYDRGRDEAERSWPWERWEGAYEMRDATLLRVSGDQHRWFLEQLVLVRTDTELRLGYVTRVARSDNGDLHVALRLYSGKPQALAVSPLTDALTEDPPVPCLLLPESAEDKASLVLPPRTFGPSRLVRSVDGGPERKYRLTRVLQRGGDFERVSFELPG